MRHATQAPPVLSPNVRAMTVPLLPTQALGEGGRGVGVSLPVSGGVWGGSPMNEPNHSINRGLFRDGWVGTNSLSAVSHTSMNLPWGEPMTDHRHLISRPYPPYLCECGQDYDPKNDRWVEPKSPEGKARREAWNERTAV